MRSYVALILSLKKISSNGFDLRNPNCALGIQTVTVRAVKLCLALAREVWMITMAIHVGHVIIHVRRFSG